MIWEAGLLRLGKVSKNRPMENNQIPGSECAPVGRVLNAQRVSEIHANCLKICARWCPFPIGRLRMGTEASRSADS